MAAQSSPSVLGTPAPPFVLPDLDGNQVSLSSAMGENGLVVAFLCNHCPYVRALISDLVGDAKTLLGFGVNLVAIMPNDYLAYPDDSPAQMHVFAEQHGFGFPYLLDETQEVARSYGAVCTPDFFGYDRDGLLVYAGRLDDGGIARTLPRTPELLNAMSALAQGGRPPALMHPSIGCSIKWKTA
jgi:peroxiredoxin